MKVWMFYIKDIKYQEYVNFKELFALGMSDIDIYHTYDDVKCNWDIAGGVLYAFTTKKYIRNAFITCRRPDMFFEKITEIPDECREEFMKKYTAHELLYKDLSCGITKTIPIYMPYHEYCHCRGKALLFSKFNPTNEIANDIMQSRFVLDIFSKDLRKSLITLGFDKFMRPGYKSVPSLCGIRQNEFNAFVMQYEDTMK